MSIYDRWGPTWCFSRARREGQGLEPLEMQLWVPTVLLCPWR